MKATYSTKSAKTRLFLHRKLFFMLWINSRDIDDSKLLTYFIIQICKILQALVLFSPCLDVIMHNTL